MVEMIPFGATYLGSALMQKRRVLASIALLSASFLAPVSGVSAQTATVAFTPEEQAYIQQSAGIKMCVDPDWAPFERITPEGVHEGIAADLVQLVAQRVGLRIEVHPVKSWDDSLAASKAGRCQIMSFLNQTPQREAWLRFTEPIFHDPNIVVAREEHPFVADLHGLTNESVALPRGTMVEERIRSEFPNLRVILTASEGESVALVSARKADLTIRSLIVAAYAIKKEGLFNLKIAGQVPQFTNQLRVGVLKNEPLLLAILDKGVRTITPQEREAISNRHVAIQVQQGIDYRLLWKVVAAAAVLLIVVFYWNRKLSRLNRKLARLSVTDQLTGLYNRLKIDQALDTEIQRAQRTGQPLSVIMLDVDHFKKVNDAFGHQVGDQVLVTLAELLRLRTREIDILGRWGGEEFIVICPHTSMDGALSLAESLRSTIGAHAFAGVKHISASMGVASYLAGDAGKDLVARADAALYAAKHAGRDRVCTSTESMPSNGDR